MDAKRDKAVNWSQLCPVCMLPAHHDGAHAWFGERVNERRTETIDVVAEGLTTYKEIIDSLCLRVADLERRMDMSDAV